MSVKGIIEQQTAMEEPLTAVFQAKVSEPVLTAQIQDLYAETAYFHNSVGTVVQQTGVKTRLLGDGQTQGVCPSEEGDGLPVMPGKWGTPDIYLPQTRQLLNIWYVKEVYTPGTTDGVRGSDVDTVYRNLQSMNRRLAVLRNTLADTKETISMPPVETTGGVYTELTREIPRIVKLLERENPVAAISPSVSAPSLTGGGTLPDLTGLTATPGGDDALSAFHVKNMESNPAFGTPAKFTVDLSVFHGMHTGQPSKGQSIQSAWSGLEAITVQTAQELTGKDYAIPAVSADGASWSTRVDRTTALMTLIGLQREKLSPKTVQTFENTYTTFVNTYETKVKETTESGPPVFTGTTYNNPVITKGGGSTTDETTDPGDSAEDTSFAVTGLPIGVASAKLQVGAIYLQARGSDNGDGRTQDGAGHPVDGTLSGIHLRWAFRKHLSRHLPKGNYYREGSVKNGLNKAEDYVRLFRTPYVRRVRTVWEVSKQVPFRGLETAEGMVWFFTCNLTDEDGNTRGTNTVWIRFRNKEHYSAAFTYRTGIVRARPINPPPPEPGHIETPEVSPEVYETILNYLKKEPIEVGVLDKLSFGLELQDFGSNLIQIEGVAVYDESSDRRYILNCRKTVQAESSCDGKHYGLIAENIEYFRLKAYGDLGAVAFETYQDFIESREDQDWKDVVASNPHGNYGKGLHVQAPSQLSSSHLSGRLSQLGPPEQPWPQYQEGQVWNETEYLRVWNQRGGLSQVISTYLQLSGDDAEAVRLEYTEGDLSTFPVSYLTLLQLSGLDYHIARMIGLGMTDFEARSKGAEEDFVYLACYTDAMGQDQVFMSLPTCRKDYRMPSVPEAGDFTFGIPGSTNAGFKINAEGYMEEENARIRFVNLHRRPYRYETTVGTFFATEAEWNLVEEEIVPVLYGIKYVSDPTQKRYDIPDLPNVNAGGLAADPSALHGKDVLSLSAPPREVPTLVADQEGGHLFLHQEKQGGTHGYALYAVNWFSCSSPIGERKLLTTTFQNPLRPLPPVRLTAWQVQDEIVPVMGTEGETEHYLEQLRLTFEWHPEHYERYKYADRVNGYYRTEGPLTVRGRVVSVEEEDDTALIHTGDTQQITAKEITPIVPSIALQERNKVEGATLTVDGISLEVVEAIGEVNYPTLRVRLPRNVKTYPAGEAPGGTEGTYKKIAIPTGKDFLLRENLNPIEKWTFWEALSLNVPDGLPPVYQGITITPEAKTERFSFRLNRNDLWWQRNAPQMENGATAEWYGGMVILTTPNSSKTYPIVAMTQGEIICSYRGQEAVSQGLYTVQVFPGYRVYLPLPKPLENHTGEVRVALVSEDTGKNISSVLSQPAMFRVERYRKALPPPEPTAPVFATRPDTFGKSTFTLEYPYPKDEELPYGMMFYRADEQALLNALYDPKTVNGIREQLALIAAKVRSGEEETDYTVNRWQELIGLLHQSNSFKEYNGYTFPEPDSPTLANISVQQALERIFVPLLASPAIISELPQNQGTIREKPTVVIGNKIRFTDYSLDGTGNNLYFYFAKETDAAYQWSHPSPVAGPISLINSLPPEHPQIRRVVAIPNNSEEGAGVRIEINAYAEWDHITDYKLFRTTEEVRSLNPRLMDEVPDLEVETGTESVALTDRFSELSSPPYGDRIYYRVMAYREVMNEQRDQEWIPSQPSEVVVSSVPDAFNPEPPVLQFKYQPPMNDFSQGIKLFWHPTVYKGKYLLYQMTSQGTWKLLAENSFLEDEDGLFYITLIPKIDEQERPIYHRFKVTVINASGLMNLREEILTVKP